MTQASLSKEQTENLSVFHDQFDALYADPIKRYKYAVVSGHAIQGLFDSFENAISFAYPKYPLGEFVVQQIIKDDEVVNFLYPALAA
jgi:hypothetical protein